MRSKCFCLVAVFAVLLLLPATVMGQVWVDGVQVDDYWGYSNYDEIGDATVNGFSILENYGSIYNATVNDRGGICSVGTITNATVNDRGWFINSESGMIDNATVYGGELNNNGWIGTATVNGGEYDDMYGNGTLSNRGRIDNMTYISGTYAGWWEGNDTIGSIGTLTLAGDSALNTGDWGDIGNLVFNENGNGIASLTVFAGRGSFGFNGIKATSVDFSYGNIALDMTVFGGMSGLYDGFYLSTLFGATGFSGVENLSSFEVTWGNNSFWILNDGVLSAGWSIDSATSYVSYSEVPEPATLLMLGLAAAGIPVVRRLRRG